MSNKIAIKVSHVSKMFKLPHDSSNSIKSKLINFRRRGYETQIALSDVSFEVNKGEFFGIVGRNGSGKSTLLKMLAEIYQPSNGTIHINGKLTPFIELGVGFNPELSGRDNVFLNGALLGFTRNQMADMYEDIVKFAELERFMDQKLKNYSSGMQVRLAFSIAIRASTDILILDEVLAVGDVNFQRKCLDYFKTLKQQKKTVVFVSHDMAAVQDFCDRAIIINNGKLIFNGDAKEAAAVYNELNFKSDDTKTGRTKGHYGEGSALIESLEVSGSSKDTKLIKPNDIIKTEVTLSASKDLDKVIFGFQIEDSSGSVVCSYNNLQSNNEITLKKGTKKVITLETKNIFDNGSYNVSAAIKSNDRTITYDQVIGAEGFNVEGWRVSTGIIHPEFKLTEKEV